MRDDERAADAGGEGDAEGVPTGFGVNAGIVEEIRQRYELDPESVHASWSELFEEEPPPERARAGAGDAGRPERRRSRARSSPRSTRACCA